MADELLDVDTLSDLPLTLRLKEALAEAVLRAAAEGGLWVGTDHVIVGMLRGASSLSAGQLLADSGVREATFRDTVKAMNGAPVANKSGKIECNDRLKRALASATAGARSSGRDKLGALLLLRALLAPGSDETVSRKALTRLAIDCGVITKSIDRKLGLGSHD